MKIQDIMEMTKLFAHLTVAFIVASHLVNARRWRDRRTIGNVDDEEVSDISRPTHRHRHQSRPPQGTFTIRDFTNGNPTEDYMAPATKKVLATLSGVDLSSTDDSNREEQGSSDHTSDRVEGSGITENTNSTINSSSDYSNCTQCYIRDEMKKLRIEAIKSQILSKLRLKEAPNVTARKIPSIPLIQRVVEDIEMQKDAPYMDDSYFSGGGEPDDFHAKTMKVIKLCNTR